MKPNSIQKAPKHPTWLSRYVEVMEQDERSEDYELMSSYVAGVIDSTSSVTVAVRKQSKSRLGYTITPRISLQRHQGDLIRVVDSWAMENGIRGKLNEIETEKGTKYKFLVERRDDVTKFLELIEPYLIVRHDVVEIILKEILPRLEDGVHREKDGFVETVQYADLVRDSMGTSGSKYDTEFFEDLWSDDL